MCKLCPGVTLCLVLLLLWWCAHASVAVMLVTLPSKPGKLFDQLVQALLHMQLLPDAATKT